MKQEDLILKSIVNKYDLEEIISSLRDRYTYNQIINALDQDVLSRQDNSEDFEQVSMKINGAKQAENYSKLIQSLTPNKLVELTNDTLDVLYGGDDE